MRILALLLCLFALPAPAAAQFDVVGDFAVGTGFMLIGEEQAAFDARSIYGAFHWNGIQLPGPEVSTGFAVEFHPATVVANGSVVNVDYRIWSLNRFNCPSALYCGTDLKIGQGGAGGYRGDFDQRIVLGLKVARGESFEVNAEFYTLEDDRPMSVAVMVRWGGSNNP